MLYKPSELAEEIGINVRQFYRVYIPLGCPCVRDRGRVYINGRVFFQWYEETYPRLSLGQNEGFCLTCRRAVLAQNPSRRVSGRLVYIVFPCPSCGRSISRIIERVSNG